MIIAGTGHRPDKLGGYGDDVYRALIALAKIALTDVKATSVISGGAIGWDTALAAAAFSLKIPYIVAVPFVGQQGIWPKKAQERYEMMLGAASQVKIVCDGGYAAYKMQRRNEWMVDNSDHILALWDGSPGGTANCMAYVTKQNKPFTNLWSKWK